MGSSISLLRGRKKKNNVTMTWVVRSDIKTTSKCHKSTQRKIISEDNNNKNNNSEEMMMMMSRVISNQGQGQGTLLLIQQHHDNNNNNKSTDRLIHGRKLPRFGYNICDITNFLDEASLKRPANIPVVLSCSTFLYEIQQQLTLMLPLGTVLNAIYKHTNWLYVQTAHGQSGYVSYCKCLPLGVLNDDKLCCQTPFINNNTNIICNEQKVDHLYLRASTFNK